jgi:hypothetical protein
MIPDARRRYFHHKKVWAFFYLVILLVACERGVEVPEYLKGVWVSDHERYKNCYLHITADSITFGQTGGTTDIYGIRNISIKTENQVQVLKIKSVNQENIDSTTEFLFSPENGGMLKFKNKVDVPWYRQAFSITQRNNKAIDSEKGYLNYG